MQVLSIRENAAKLAALETSLAIIEFTLDGTILTANQNFLKLVGYRLEEIKGKHHRIFVDTEQRDEPEYRRFWEALRRGEYQSAQYKRVGKGGREVWIEASYNPILDWRGEPFKIVKFATDVSGQKAEYADLLGKVEAINRSQAVIEFSLDGTIITANENFLAVVGYSLAEIKGKHHSMFVEPGYRASADYARFWDSLRQGKHQAAQFRRIGKGGREIWLQASYNPILDLNGRPWKVVKFATDLSARKRQNAALADEFETGVKSLVGEVSAAANDIQVTAQSLAAAAEQTSKQTADVSNATEELSNSVSEISRHLSVSAGVINTAVTMAEDSEKMVGELVKAAGKIGEVTKIINDIAAQTNLLALNATIEAARAGDAGKGFAVVANEVKALATQTARATDEIERQIKGMQDITKATAAAIAEIAKVVSRVSEISVSISGAVEEQSAATRDVSINIDGVAQASGEASDASINVLAVAESLARQSDELDRRVDQFLENVRAM